MTETIELAIAEGTPLEKKTITRLMDMVIESNYLELLTKEEYVSISDVKKMAADLTDSAGPNQGIDALIDKIQDSLLK